jgi:hypothetical protein
MFANTTKYCPTCNYPREPDQRYTRTNERCPMCDLERLDTFYSVGSETHRRILNGEKLQPIWALRAPEL